MAVKITDFNTGVQPTWCPGCGAYAVKNILPQALAELNLPPHKIVITYDIGCNGNGADKINTYAVKSLHGRSMLPAIGAKYANHDLTVISTIGDGAMMWEGAEHWITSAQRNEDITVILYNNEIYGLTTGQTSGATPCGVKTVSYPYGTVDQPMNPVLISIASGATFVARAFVGKPQHMKEIFKQAIQHKGFAIVDVIMQCVTWTKIDMLSYYKDTVYGLEQDENDKPKSGFSKTKYDCTDKALALRTALQKDKIPIGVIYKEEAPTITDKYSPLKKGALVKQKPEGKIEDLLKEFY